MVFHETRLRDGNFKIRGVEASDLPALVAYWHDRGPDFLRSLGADPDKLPQREETARRFLGSIPRPGENQERATFIVEDDRRQPIAYTNINFSSSEEGVIHFHVLRPGPLGKAVAYLLFPEMVRIYFECFPLRRIVMQTSPANRNINRFLQRFGLEPQLRHLAKPDGMARPGDFNVYEIERGQAGRISRRTRAKEGAPEAEPRLQKTPPCGS